MKPLFKILAATFVAATALTIQAQELRTAYFMETAKFRHQMNPALLEDSPYLSFPLLGNIHLQSTGNFGGETLIYEIAPVANGGRRYGTFLHPEVSNEQFFDRLGTDDLRGSTHLNYNIFSLAFRGFGGTNLIEVNARSSTDFRLPNSFFHLAKEGWAHETYHITDLGLRHRGFAEIVLGHSHKITDRITIGAKAKFLLGLSYADLDVHRLDLTLSGDHWRVEGEAEGSMALMKTRIRTTEQGKFDDLDDIKGGLAGTGLAFDLGATYKVHGVEGLTLSAALTDLGSFSCSDAQNFATRQGASWTFDGFDNVYVASDKEGSKELGDEFERIGDDLSDALSLYETAERGASAGLAATLNLGAEYRLPAYDRLRFGLLHTARMAGDHSWSQTMLSATIRPVRAIELGVSAATSTTGGSLGAMLTLNAPHFQVHIGADKFLGKLSKEGIPVKDLDGGLSFGITFPL